MVSDDEDDDDDDDDDEDEDDDLRCCLQSRFHFAVLLNLPHHLSLYQKKKCDPETKKLKCMLATRSGIWFYTDMMLIIKFSFTLILAAKAIYFGPFYYR